MRPICPEDVKSRGLEVMAGEILSENSSMLSLARRLGFTMRPCEGDPTVQEAIGRL
jgi:hypothetical protein